MNRAELCRQGGERRAASRLSAEGHGRITDERSAALLGENQPLITELTERALNSHELHAKLFGELPGCGELVARGVLAVGARDLRAVLRRNLLGRGRLLGRFGALVHSYESNRT